MKRKAFEKHLREHGCTFIAHLGRHDGWRDPQGQKSVVPRHREVNGITARAICKQLGIPVPLNPN